MDNSYEIAIGKKICDILPVEWIKFNMFNTNDIFNTIPMLVFRVNYLDENMDRLKNCINLFKGRESWKLFRNPLSRNNNFILSIEVVEKILLKSFEDNKLYNERDYLGDEEYEMKCINAIQDIPLLSEAINHFFL